MKTEAELIKTLSNTPPVECGLKVGDIVTFTNDCGVSFPGKKVIGFAKDDSFHGRFIHLSKDAYWFPVRADQIRLEN